MFQPLIGLPKVTTERIARDRRVSANGIIEVLPGGGIIDGTKSRDSNNSDSIRCLRAGTLMGKVTSGGKWAPSAIGVLDAAYASGTSLTLDTAAEAVELVRRIGSSGTFTLTGPPTAAGTVRSMTVTYSAVNQSTGAVTITALPVADVWTLTAPAGQDAGMYQLEITTGKGTSAESVQTTAALAANANSATVDAALEALTNVGAGNVVAVYADPTLTLTFAATLGPVHVRVLADTTNDGGVFEGGWAAVHTTTGVDGRFVAGSIIGGTDGSQTPLSFIPDGYGVFVPDDGNGTTVDFPWNIPIRGVLTGSQLLPWPSDTSLKAWVRSSLRTYCPDYTFADQLA